MSIVWMVFAVSALVLVTMSVWRRLDSKADESAWFDLASQGNAAAGIFDPRSIRHLPEPARRYFEYSIRPGSPLVRAVEIEMTGEIGLGSQDDPKYRRMRARQVLAPPFGLVWRADAGPISGSDGVTSETSWTRFWLFGLLPIVRTSGNPDHHRSAFGRVVAEAALWAPASLLPSAEVRWEAIDDTSARAVVSFGKFTQAVEVSVADDGRPTRVFIRRWSNENPDRMFREQPFGGFPREFRDFGGYRLPTAVEGGYHIGSADYFPFFKALVTDIRLLGESCKVKNI